MRPRLPRLCALASALFWGPTVALCLLAANASADDGAVTRLQSGFQRLSQELDGQLLALVAAVVLVLLVILVAFRSQVRDLVRREVSEVRRSESQLLEVTAAISQEIQLQPLLQRIMETVTEILEADRSTLFLFDPRSGELWSNIAQGLDMKEIRFPAHLGIAGSVFGDGQTINIPDAYKDKRFNQEIDRKTGYKTDTILCMRIESKSGSAMGVIQVLNKVGGPFSPLDEQRLRAFTAQAAIAIENAQLFEEVNRVKNYNEAILASMSTAVVTFDATGAIVKANQAALRLFEHVDEPDRLIGSSAERYFVQADDWLAEAVANCLSSGEPWDAVDASLHRERATEPGVRKRASLSVNVNLLPLNAPAGDRIGLLMMVEDITMEKRLKTTVARYMPKEIADRLIEGGEAVLGGTVGKATILFSDIRDFTAFSERCGPQETVAMLNGYFSVMANLVMANGGILDKYIGDAILAVYGAPFAQPMDADNAVHTAIAMMTALRRFNSRRSADGKETLAIGIGISTGEVVSGNIGSDKRMDYTVIGDGVNLAARLESATKAYQARVLLSDLTRASLTGDFLLRDVDLLRVKGKTQPVAVYEAMAAYGQSEFSNLDEVMSRWPAAMTAYRQARWVEARTLFEECIALNPSDGLAVLYANRCNFFFDQPPGDDWDGVWNMKEK